ncbi:MAG: site-2 protease family protein [Polyangia bacterium]|jgi:Zn-dependent protease|nr:site-2 protease family protein [Polyangia bacterium]
MGSVNLAELAIWYPAFLLSLTFHEASHAFISSRLGDRTAAGQVTLNPIPHIRQEPVGTVLVPLVTFLLAGWTLGWASAPYDPRWANRYPKRAGMMSLAGPLANFLLAGAALGAIWLLVAADLLGFNAAPTRLTNFVVGSDGGATFLAQFLTVLYLLNLILGFFNLIPVPPLDGAGVIQGLFAGSGPARALASLQEKGFGLMGLMLAWVLFRYLLSPLVLWIFLVGLGRIGPLVFG